LPPKSPKGKSEAESYVLIGRAYREVRTGRPIGLPPKAYVPDPKLEAALETLRKVIGKAGADDGTGRAKI
jgi:hypothetical protein